MPTPPYGVEEERGDKADPSNGQSDHKLRLFPILFFLSLRPLPHLLRRPAGYADSLVLEMSTYSRVASAWEPQGVETPLGARTPLSVWCCGRTLPQTIS